MSSANTANATAPQSGAVSISGTEGSDTLVPAWAEMDDESTGPTASHRIAAERTKAMLSHYATRATVGFIHEQEPPADWVEQLEEFSPACDDHGFLRLVWEPGDPWNPVQRWELYEMLHPSIVHPAELAALRGPHPRLEGHMCSVHVPDQFQCLCEPKAECWVQGPNPGITLTEWKLFRRTGYVGRRFWLIQGKRGGNRFSYTHHERLMLEAAGLPTEAPGSGRRAYAPFDGRTIAQVKRFNRLWQWSNNLAEYRYAMGDGYKRHMASQQKALRIQLLAFLREMALDVGEDFIAAADAGEMDNLPTTDIDYDRLAERNEEHFAETGKILHHSKI